MLSFTYGGRGWELQNIANIVYGCHLQILSKFLFLGKQVNWYFDVFASPNPRYIWYDPKGNEIDHHHVTKYEFHTSELPNSVNFGNSQKLKYTLTINELELKDIGHYTFEIEVANENQSLSKTMDFYLLITHDPKVFLQKPNFESTNQFYIADRIETFKCSVQGYPIDISSLHWTFRWDFKVCWEISRNPLKS